MLEALAMMMGFSLLFYIAYRLGSTVFAILFWFAVKLPVALCLLGFGSLLCFTIIFFPWGVKCIRLSWAVLF